MTLVEFLTARLDEDEAVARATYPRGDVEPGTYFALVELSERTPHESRCGWRLGEGLDDTCECHYPARVLREVEAMRRVVELADVDPVNGWSDIHAALASVYSDHPDYNPDWA